MAFDANDITVLQASKENGSIFTKYYLAGFGFLPWQLMFHHAIHPAITCIGGVGSGKTVGAGCSAATWSAMTPYFKFMNVAPTSWQSSLMYADILNRAEVGRYREKFIRHTVRKPYPVIYLINGSTLEFMTAQDDIVKLRSWEGDWMHLDEGGFVPTLATTLGVMRTRLRGKTATGRPRLGRLSLTSTATDNPDLWDRFDRHLTDSSTYLSFTVRSDDNMHLSRRDLELMREEIPEELRAIEMDGVRPLGRGEYFPLHVVQMNEDTTINDTVHRATLEPYGRREGFVYEETPRHGLIRYQLPYLPHREYLIAGDPGTGNLPRRNAGAIGVFDITGFPYVPGSVAKLVAFAWVSGGGRYEPFEIQYKTWWEYYRCGFNAALESTGPQKSYAEYAFNMGLQGQEMWITGIDMSGNRKKEALQATIQIFQRAKFRIPLIRGMRSQLIGYTLPDAKIAQDLVSMLMTAAAWLRSYKFWGKDLDAATQPTDPVPQRVSDYEIVTSQEDPRVARAAALDERPRR
jgi:hypothetical protein